MDFRFGQLAALVAGAVGMKDGSGSPLGPSAFFPSLVVQVERPVDRARDAVRIRGMNPSGEAGVMAGWDQWAQMCKAISSRNGT